MISSLRLSMISSENRFALFRIMLSRPMSGSAFDLFGTGIGVPVKRSDRRNRKLCHASRPRGPCSRSAFGVQRPAQPADLAGLLGTGAGAHRLFRLLGFLDLGFFLGALASDRQQHLALALGALLRLLAFGLGSGAGGGLGGRGSRLLAVGKAALERVHQIDDVAARL